MILGSFIRAIRGVQGLGVWTVAHVAGVEFLNCRGLGIRGVGFMTVGLYDSGLSLHGVTGEESRQSTYAQQFLFTVTITECMTASQYTT